MQTIAEVPHYIKQSERLLDKDDRKEIIDYLSNNPVAGSIIQGTGGIRKLRWKRDGKGKSGGVRLIYYYHNQNMPLYLLTVYPKGEKDNLSKAECNELKELTKLLREAWGE